MSDDKPLFIEVIGGPHDGVSLPEAGDPPFEIALNHADCPSTHLYQINFERGYPRYVHVGVKPTTKIVF